MLRFTVTFSMLFPNVCGVHKTSFVFVAIYFGLDEETARTGCSVALIKDFQQECKFQIKKTNQIAPE